MPPQEIVNPEPTSAASPAVTASLEAQVVSGGSWFYWVAALSLINSIMLASGSDRSFVIGLGLTQAIDLIAAAIGGTAIRVLGFVVNLGVAGLFASFGYFAVRRRGWAFVVGMIVYLGDGVLYVLVGDWLSVAFHAYVLFSVYSGFSAHRKLKAVAAMNFLPPGIVAG